MAKLIFNFEFPNLIKKRRQFFVYLTWVCAIIFSKNEIKPIILHYMFSLHSISFPLTSTRATIIAASSYYYICFAPHRSE